MKHIPIFLVALFTFVCSSSHAKLKLIIDPGHGGSDKGATHAAAVESRIVLGVAQKLKEALTQYSEFDVVLSRESDRSLSLEDRRRFVEQTDGEIFVSLHANSSPDRRASGVEVYFQNPLAYDEVTALLAHERAEFAVSSHKKKGAAEEALTESNDIQNILFDLKKSRNIWRSQELARLIIKNWNFEGANKKRRVAKQAPFYLVSQLHTPAVLVELGFVTHAEESKLLQDPHYQQKMAHTLAQSLQKFRESEAE